MTRKHSDHEGGEQYPNGDQGRHVARLVELIKRQGPELEAQVAGIIGSIDFTPDEQYAAIVGMYMQHVPAETIEPGVGDTYAVDLHRGLQLRSALQEFESHARSMERSPMRRLHEGSKEVVDSALFIGTLAVAHADSALLESAEVLKSRRARKVIAGLSAAAALMAVNDVCWRVTFDVYDGQTLLSAGVAGGLAWLASAFHRAGTSTQDA